MFLFRSVRNWLTLLFVLLIGLASAVSWLYVVPPLKTKLVQQKLTNLRAYADPVYGAIEQELKKSIENGKVRYTAELQNQVSALASKMDVRIVVFNPADLKLAVADSVVGPLKPADFPMVATAIRSGKITSGLAAIGKVDYTAVALPVVLQVENLPSGMAAVVLISSSLRDVYSAVSLVERQIVLATILALAVTFIAGYLASFLIARRLTRIERGAEAIAGGDFDVRLRVRIRDEIGQLAASFNAMGARLRTAFSSIQQEKKSAETILNTLSEGVIGVAADGTVLSANPMAVKVLGRRLRIGAAAGDAFPEEVRLMWSELHATGTEEPVVFELRGRTLEADTYPVGAGTDLDSIIVLRDVTAQARLERARRDFVANASHEFKTPLFSLSGFLELLDEEGIDGEERAEFLQLMKEQVERLQSLSLSLLDLSQVDAGAVRLHPAPVDVAGLATSVAAEFQARAAERRLEVGVDLPDQPVEVTCDDERLAQVLRALLDNAIKFTGDGGSVNVKVSRDDVRAGITVSDTGGGIPATELPRIFDRFYRGSLTRGSKGGTGLGLSIARDLTQLMGGRLTATSRVGSGSQFIVTLPLRPPGPADEDAEALLAPSEAPV